MNAKEKFVCISNEELSSFKMKWILPKSTVNQLFVKKSGSIKSSVCKLKFLNSSWHLKVEYEKNKDVPLVKLYLDEADIDESIIWASHETVIFTRFFIVEDDGIPRDDEEGTIEEDMDDVWETNLRQTGMTIEERFQFYLDDIMFNYIIIECTIKLKVVINNTTIKSTPRLAKSDTNDEILEVMTVPREKSTEPPKTNNGILLETGKFSDISFNVGTKTFKAHRAILVVQSEYFDTMFNSGWNESNELVPIDVTDVEPEIFEALLKYLYTKETPLNLDIVARDLLVAADKYLVRELIEICEEKLCKTIDHDNCVELLTFGDTYSCKKLKEEAMFYIKPRMKQILETEEWKELMKKRTELALEMIKISI